MCVTSRTRVSAVKKEPVSLLVASVEDDARQCQALGLVHRDNPRLDARVHVHVHV